MEKMTATHTCVHHIHTQTQTSCIRAEFTQSRERMARRACAPQAAPSTVHKYWRVEYAMKLGKNGGHK